MITIYEAPVIIFKRLSFRDLKKVFVYVPVPLIQQLTKNGLLTYILTVIINSLYTLRVANYDD